MSNNLSIRYYIEELYISKKIPFQDENEELYKYNWRKAQLQGTNLRGFCLHRLDMTEANLSLCYLRHASLSESCLVKAQLTMADLREASLYLANLEKADLTYADLERADLEQANLTEAILEGANLKDVYARGANFKGANLSQAIFNNTNLKEANMEGANLEKAEFEDETKLCKANLSNANLSNLCINNVDMRGAILKGANLKNSYFYQADLDLSNFMGANLEETYFGDNHRKLEEIPHIPHIDATILAMLDSEELLNKDEKYPWVAWTLRVAGTQADPLVEEMGERLAASAIYIASQSHPVPDWYASREDAIRQLRQRSQSVASP